MTSILKYRIDAATKLARGGSELFDYIPIGINQR